MPQPDLILTPFAQDAPPSAVDSIPEVRSPADPLEKATWTQGFPGLTMMPLAAGGIPPRGQDVNGVLKAISEHTVFVESGGQYKWDAEFAAANGYPLGAVLQKSANNGFWLNTVDGNSSNPDSGGAGWVDESSTLMPYAIDNGAANAYAATYVPAITSLSAGLVVRFKASNANTGASTFNPNGIGAKPIVTLSGTAISSGAIAANSHVWLQYDPAIGPGSWVLLLGGSLNLGTAAQRDVGTADGNVMEVGAGGWLKYPANYTVDLNSQPQRSEIFAWTLGAIGAPVTAGDGIYIARAAGTAGHRLMFGLDESRAWLQARLQSGGAFNTAVELITTANISQNTPFGANQIPVDVTASRVIGTVYTNTTGAPIFLAIYTPAGTGASSISLSADGVSGWIETGVRSAASGHYQYAIVPPGWRYKSDAATIGKWVEWRKT